MELGLDSALVSILGFTEMKESLERLIDLDNDAVECPANATGSPDCECDAGFHSDGTLTFVNGTWTGQCTRTYN